MSGLPLEQPTVSAMWAAVASHGEHLLCCSRIDREGWRGLRADTLVARAQRLAAALLRRGLLPAAPVGLFADHGEQWLIAHAAIQLAAAVDVPRGSDVSNRELTHICGVTAMGWAFAASPDLAARVRERSPGCRIILLNGEPSHEAELPWHQLLEEAESAEELSELCRRQGTVEESDLHSIIFTSATTGKPKGVMLSHGAMMAQLRAIAAVPIPLGFNDRLLSLLPVWHIFERTASLYAVACGASLWFTSPRRFADDLAQVQPSFMASAPRLWEALDARIAAAVRKSHPVRRALVAAGRFCSRHFRAASRAIDGRRPHLRPQSLALRWAIAALNVPRWLLFLAPHGLLNTAVLERIRQSTGACLKATVSGGGALPPAVDEFFTDLGLPVLEGYGMTEFPVISVRVPGRAVPGTVGPPLPGVELRLADPESGAALPPGQRGEIQARGAMAMSGYWQDEQASAATLLAGGWLRTGDLGEIGADGCLRIVGRCKDTIVLRSGENVEPGPIEDAIRRSPLVEQVVVVGQDAKHLGALVVPDCAALAHALGLAEEGFDVAAAAAHPQASALLRHEVHRLVSREQGFRPYELVQGVALLPRPLELGEELTKLLKVRRHIVHERWAAEIRRICGGD